MLIKISSASVFSTWLFLESFYCLARFEFKTFGFFFGIFLTGLVYGEIAQGLLICVFW